MSSIVEILATFPQWVLDLPNIVSLKACWLMLDSGRPLWCIEPLRCSLSDVTDEAYFE